MSIINKTLNALGRGLQDVADVTLNGDVAPQNVSRPRNREPWTETSGSNIKGVDRRLTDIMSRAAMELSARHPGYTVEGFSGKKGRTSGTPNHPAGRAIDVNIIGPDGKALKNEKNGTTFSAYHELAQIAQGIQKQDYPELDSKFAWGGNFSQGVSFDQMHFDIGGMRGAYGTIEGGLNAAGRAAMGRMGFRNIPDTYAWDSTGIPAGPRTADTAGIPGVTSDLPEYAASLRGLAQGMPASSLVSSLGSTALSGTRDAMGAGLARISKAATAPGPSTVGSRFGSPAALRATYASPAEQSQNLAHLTNPTPTPSVRIGGINPIKTTETVTGISPPDPARFGPVAPNPERFGPVTPQTTQEMALAHLMPTGIDFAGPLQNALTGNLQAPVQAMPQVQQRIAAPPLSAPRYVKDYRVASVPSVDPLAGKTIGGIKPDQRSYIGTGLDAINSVMGGPKGATAFSASDPHLSVISRGPNIGTAIHNMKTGTTTLYSPSGSITGVQRSKQSGGFLSGFFGGGSGGGNSLGGGYSGGSSNSGGASFGGRSIGGAGSTYSR